MACFCPCRQSCTCDDGIAMNIETGASPMEGLHRAPPSRCHRREAFVQEIYPPCYRRSLPLARQGQTGQQIQVLRRLPVKLTHGLDCTKTMRTSVPAAPDLTFRFVPPGAPAVHGN